MTFSRWQALSETEREAEKQSWFPFEPGYWHSLALEAAARFQREFGSKRHVTRVYKSLYRARELIVAVQTNSSKIELPASYLGFRVVQFANRIPAGVLVDPGPADKSLPRKRNAIAKRQPPDWPRRIQEAKLGSRRIVRLEGEIDMHVSPRIKSELREIIREKPKKLVVDLSRLSYIDSSGLAALINAMQKVEAYRGKFYLIRMPPAIRLIFETSGLKEVFRIRRDLADLG